MTNTLRWMVSCGLMTAGVMVLASSCEPKPETAERQVEEAATGGVAAANYPLAYFAETLLGGALPVVFDAPGDEDPAFWEPDDAALERIQEARVILMNGAGYSKWADQASLPTSRVVDTSAGFAAELIEVKAGVTHSHGPEGEHAHAGTAFTTWIDFEQAGRQLEAAQAALLKVVEEGERPGVEKRGEELRARLRGWDERARAAGNKLAGRAMLGSHPVYQYLARRYGLNLREVHWEPEVVPDEEALEELKGILKEHPARVMIWEGDPAEKTVELLKAMGIDSVVFDPCGNRPEEGDFSTVMEANVATLEALAR